MDSREFFCKQSVRNNSVVSKLAHRTRRAILQEMRSVADRADTNWLVVPAGCSLGSFAVFHMLNKRKNEDGKASDEDE